jgi:hypothetical protein
VRGTGPLPVDGSASGNPGVVAAAGRLPGRYQSARSAGRSLPWAAGRLVRKDPERGIGEAGGSVLFRHPARNSAQAVPRNGHRGARNVPPGARNSDVEQSKRSGTVAGTTDGSGSGPRNEVTPTSTGPVAYSQLVLQAAEQNPRLLIDEPGWTATTVYGFAEKEGTIAWSKGVYAIPQDVG